MCVWCGGGLVKECVWYVCGVVVMGWLERVCGVVVVGWLERKCVWCGGCGLVRERACVVCVVWWVG